MNKELKNAIKKAVAEYKDWKRATWPFGYAVIRFDLEDHTVWTDVYTDENNWSVYHSDSIININGELWDESVTIKSVTRAIESLILSQNE